MDGTKKLAMHSTDCREIAKSVREAVGPGAEHVKRGTKIGGLRHSVKDVSMLCSHTGTRLQRPKTSRLRLQGHLDVIGWNIQVMSKVAFASHHARTLVQMILWLERLQLAKLERSLKLHSVSLIYFSLRRFHA